MPSKIEAVVNNYYNREVIIGVGTTHGTPIIQKCHNLFARDQTKIIVRNKDYEHI